MSDNLSAGLAAIQRDDVALLKELTKEFNQLCNRLADVGVRVDAEIESVSIFGPAGAGVQRLVTLRTAAYQRLA
jgi:hypothetical protein